MTGLSARSRAVLTDFGHQPDVTADQANNLVATIQLSPTLVEQFNSAVAQGHLRQIVPLANPNAGGEYDGTSKAMRLPLADLTTGSQSYDQGNVIFVLGHELQHGFNHAAKEQAVRDFYNEARNVANRSTTMHDFTMPIGKLIAANRRDEASAEIAGWNAVVSAVRTTHSNPALEDIYKAQKGRMADFVGFDRTSDGYKLKPNLILNPDLTLSPTPSNIEAMGKNYFDKAPRHPGGLGYRGNSDYANYYGAYTVGVIAQLERQYHPSQPGIGEPARVTLNMTSLRLSEKLIEENGIDLGRNTHSLPYMDSSSTPPTLHHFDHTATTHTYVPIQAQATMAPIRLDDPAHADYLLFRQSMDGVQQLNANHEVAPDAVRDANLAGALTLQAVAQGFTRIDQVVLSDDAKYAFATRDHHIAEPLNRWAARVETERAINTPLEQSSAQWSQAAEQRDQVRAQQQMHGNALQQHTHAAPYLQGMSN